MVGVETGACPSSFSLRFSAYLSVSCPLAVLYYSERVELDPVEIVL
jgi:hypothetical protein